MLNEGIPLATIAKVAKTSIEAIEKMLYNAFFEGLCENLKGGYSTAML